MDQYFEGLPNVAITVCDADANILDMNQHSADVDGGKVKKLIYQTPWFKEDGAFGGLIEYSIEIPFDMPHFVRQPKTN